MAQGRLPRSQSHVSMLHKELPFLTVHLAVPAANGWLISLHMPSFTLMAISVTSPLQTCCHMRSRFRPPIVVRRDRGGESENAYGNKSAMVKSRISPSM